MVVGYIWQGILMWISYCNNMHVYKVQQHEFFVSEHCTINILLLQCELCCTVAKLVCKIQECNNGRNFDFSLYKAYKLFILAAATLFWYLLLQVVFM